MIFNHHHVGQIGCRIAPPSLTRAFRNPARDQPSTIPHPNPLLEAPPVNFEDSPKNFFHCRLLGT
jgi:hypothetical protein